MRAEEAEPETNRSDPPYGIFRCQNFNMRIDSLSDFSKLGIGCGILTFYLTNINS